VNYYLILPENKERNIVIDLTKIKKEVTYRSIIPIPCMECHKLTNQMVQTSIEIGTLLDE
jgi:hypothetical protein